MADVAQHIGVGASTGEDSNDRQVFQLNIMASFAQLERAITKERQADGIRAAKERGVYQGRARKLTAEQLATARELIANDVPKAQVARRLDIDRTTLYRTLARDQG